MTKNGLDATRQLRHSRWVALLLLLLVAAQLATFVHLVTVHHGVCAEHGEVGHVGGDAHHGEAGTPHREDTGDDKGPVIAPEEHRAAHPDHCPVVRLATARAAVPFRPLDVRPRTAAPAALPHPADPGRAPRVALWLLAPTNSPPRSA